MTVSHDESFLEGVTLSTVAEVANSRVEVFKGCGFKKFLFERDERMRSPVFTVSRALRNSIMP